MSKIVELNEQEITEVAGGKTWWEWIIGRGTHEGDGGEVFAGGNG